MILRHSAASSKKLPNENAAQLRIELLRQFESRITEQINQNGVILDSVHKEIIAVRQALLSRLVALPVGYQVLTWTVREKG